jgi:HEAT repeat protein
MRQHIMFMLGQSKDPEAVPQMIEILRAERDPSLRKSGIIWLGQSRDPRAIKFISELIGG